MVTNNKVLTVSYGTFSCTLEGFDDSFDTMKAIAEYFRDLAADDRYFGAEPPTPDAEMLTRIAEREIERRVQARHEAGAIVLSAAPAMAESAEAPSPEKEQSEDPQAEPQTEELASEEPAAELVEEEVIAEETPVEVEEAPAEEMEPAAPEAPAEDIVEEAADADVLELDIQSIVDASNEDLAEATADEVVEEEAEPVVEDAAEEFFASSEEADIEAEADEEDTVNLFEDAFEEADEEEPVAEDSIAAKLRRIRAVVSKAESSDDDEDDYIEDQHADLSAPIDLDMIDDAFEAEAASEAVDAEDDGEAEEFVAAQEEQKPRARVIRMKRADFEQVVSDGLLEEAEETDEVAEEAPETSLSDEDEADLMAELAMVDAELAEANGDVAEPEEMVEEAPAEEIAEESVEAVAEDDAPEMDEKAAKRERRRERRAKLDAAQPGEEAVDRLIEEANTKLDEPEGNRRRSAIAHLRAAVAATKAEKQAGKSFEKEDNSEAYRDDLAEAVRPRKSKSAPPLKLVAEQRIDTPQDEKAAGIRPRRVSVDDIAAAEANEASSNFVEFAENMGATQLPEVLEAAASYLTFVEGRKKFSRPMLMRLAYQVGNDRFEREAGLRSFGQLLRDKKIEKIAGGRFTVSDAINFKPADREAG